MPIQETKLRFTYCISFVRNDWIFVFTISRALFHCPIKTQAIKSSLHLSFKLSKSIQKLLKLSLEFPGYYRLFKESTTKHLKQYKGRHDNSEHEINIKESSSNRPRRRLSFSSCLLSFSPSFDVHKTRNKNIFQHRKHKLQPHFSHSHSTLSV